MIKFFRKIRQKLLVENRFNKYLLYAIGEIILVVIGILIALQLNNWNETRAEQKKIKQYAKSLIEDLKNDIEMLEVSQRQAAKKHREIDSLKNYMTSFTAIELSNTFLFMVSHDIMYRPYKWNRSTLNELKNSGGLRYITNDSLQKMLVAYESFSYHLNEDYEFDVNSAQKAEEIMAKVLNLNSPYLSNVLKVEAENFGNRNFNVYNTDAYKTAFTNDIGLLTNDEKELQQFLNKYILIQGNYRTRAFSEMPQIMIDAKKLIEEFKKEYKLD